MFLEFDQETRHHSGDGLVVNGEIDLNENGFQTPSHSSEDEDGYEGKRGTGMHVI